MKYYNFKKKVEKRYSANTTIIFVTIFVSVVFFILQLIDVETIKYFALYPKNILAGKYLWTLLTHIFVHGGIGHLLINMFALFSLGGICEKIIGRKRYIWFYLITGIFAGLLSVLMAGFFGYGYLAKVFGSPEIYMVGASGAIFGIAGLFVILLPKVRFTIIFLPFFSLPAYIMVPAVLILTWLTTIATNLPIGNVAHFGGFLTGIIYGYYLRVKYKKKVIMLERYFR
ncbi:rhomboid family intramembrane serine protease [Candidatus Pacearchaeota archaeon]|nr:rhomboid family intramembrane serine protease [Candidatus Pacearchaeota archaeon]